jgi:hypothetical protein
MLITIAAVGSSDVCISVVIWYVLWVPNVFLTRCTALDRSLFDSGCFLVSFGCLWCYVWCVFCFIFIVLFCSSICCLCGDLSLLGFDRAMFVDF